MITGGDVILISAYFRSGKPPKIIYGVAFHIPFASMPLIKICFPTPVLSGSGGEGQSADQPDPQTLSAYAPLATYFSSFKNIPFGITCQPFCFFGCLTS